MHLMQNVTTSYQLSIDIELGVCWPLAIGFNLLSDDVIIKNIDSFIFSDPIFLEEFHNKVGIAATGCIRSSFHEETYLVIFNPFFNDLRSILSGELRASLIREPWYEHGSESSLSEKRCCKSFSEHCKIYLWWSIYLYLWILNSNNHQKCNNVDNCPAYKLYPFLRKIAQFFITLGYLSILIIAL